MLQILGKYSVCKHFFGTLRKNRIQFFNFSFILNPSYYGMIQKYHYSRIYSVFRKTTLHNSNCLTKVFYSENAERPIDKLTFINVCTETLDSLSEYFEELVESVPHLKSADVTYSDGVLTVQFGNKFGTYVINRQTPNLQIWLSSPTSGPKRYDFCGGTWVYKHDKSTLHSLLDQEIKEIANQKVEFSVKCLYGKPEI